MRALSPVDGAMRVRAVKYEGRSGVVVSVEDEVAEEALVRLYVDGEHVATFTSTPTMLREHAIGFLLTEGVVGGVEEVEGVDVRGLEVHVRLRGEARRRAEDLKRRALTGPPSAPQGCVASALRVKASAIVEAVERLNEGSQVYRRTGGTHAAALFDAEARLIAMAEDVGRHNALDKAVGGAVMRGAKLSEAFMAVTGRLSYELVSKVARCGIPLAASISAPTSLGIELASRCGVTLVGFVRGGRLSVYTNPWRVLSD